MDSLPEVNSDLPYCPECGSHDRVLCEDCGEHWDRCLCVNSIFACEYDMTFFEWLPPPDPDMQQLLLDVNDDDYDEMDDWDVAVQALLYEEPYNLKSYEYEEDEVSRNKRGSRRGGKQKYQAPKKHTPTKYSHWEVGGGQYKYQKCDHMMQPVTFKASHGESVTVYATAGRQQKERTKANMPDFGLYLDSIWRPVARNEYINWPDMSVPADSWVAFEQIIDAFIRACEGERVEVGCIGAHGRTGTVLACMGILAGMGPREAILFVRESYCREAIETANQEKWIHWFHGVIKEEAR